MPRLNLTQDGQPEWGLHITWHGHSCFTVRDSTGRTLVFDPFDDTVGYGRLRLRADALLITHSHFDHNEKRAVRPRGRELELMETTGSSDVAGRVTVTGIESFHDDEGGQIHGPNRIFTFMMGGFRVVHMGDIGQKSLTDRQRAMIGAVDVLMIPVGGETTIGPVEAKAFVDQLKPRAVFPMHHGNIRFYKLTEVSEFTALFPASDVRRPDSATVHLRPEDLSGRPLVFLPKTTDRNY